MTGIEIGGKERPIKFGFAAIGNFCQRNGLTISQTQNMGGLINESSKGYHYVIDLLYCGLLYGAKREGMEIDFTFDDVEAWLSDNPEMFGVALVMFDSSQAPEPEPSKKKELKKRPI